jgi:hypothetical protein
MRRLTFAAALIAMFAQPAAAQQSTLVELGLDASFSYGFDDLHQKRLTIPVQRIRAGFFMSPEISIEPSFGLEYTGVNSSSSTVFTTGIGLLYHLETSRTSAQPYVRPFIEYSRVSGSGSSPTVTNTTFGGGLGLKIPFSDRLAWRLEAGAGFNQNNSHLLLLAGFSYFTR